jgi:hypothetical protein
VIRDDSGPSSGPSSAPFPGSSHLSGGSQVFTSTPHSYSELVDLRQQMSAIRLEREEWKERENQHRKREQEMLDQINRTQEQLQIALSSGGFLGGVLDQRPHTPEDDSEGLDAASKTIQLGPALDDESLSDDREYYSLPPSRTRRERHELSDFTEEPSEYSEEEPPREYRRRYHSYHEDDDDNEYFYTLSPRRSSRYHERPRSYSYEPEYERRRRHQRSYTPPSLDSDMSGDYIPEYTYTSPYTRRHEDDDHYNYVDVRGHELYSDEEIPEYTSHRSRSRSRSRSRTSSHRSLSRSGSLNRNGSRNRSRSGSRNESRSGSRSQIRSQPPSRNSSYNLSRRSSSRRHSSHHVPEDYYEQELYVAPRNQSRKHQRTRSSGSVRLPGPHPGEMHYPEWPEMHEPFYPMPEPQFPIHPPFPNMHHPAMASHMSLPELGLGHEPQPAPPPQPSVNAASQPPQQSPSIPTPRPNMANEVPVAKDGPRGILRKPSGSLQSMAPQQLPPQSQHGPHPGPQHPPFPMQHFGPLPPHMMGPMPHSGQFPSPGMPPHPHMPFPPPPHGMFPQGGPPWHGPGQQPMPMQGGPMGPPGNVRQSRKS